MKFFALLIVFVFASKDENDFAGRSPTNSGQEKYAENPILVKIEENEYFKKKSSDYIGVTYDKDRWRVRRWSKKKYKMVHNGSYKNEVTAARASDTLARQLFAHGGEYHKLNFPNDNIEVQPEEKTKKNKYFGVYYNTRTRCWLAQRWNKREKQLLYNGSYKEEKTAARASDTLARQLMADGEQKFEINFPDDRAEVHAEKRTKKSKYYGVYYAQDRATWRAKRWSQNENKFVDNGYYRNEETAAHASDTLARKLMNNSRKNLRLNFIDDNTEVHKRAKSSKYFGVSYNAKTKRWFAQRYSRTQNVPFNNGTHKYEEAAAHASDTLARQLMANGEDHLKLNFPDDNTEIRARHRTSKRKRSPGFENLQTNLKNF